MRVNAPVRKTGISQRTVPVLVLKVGHYPIHHGALGLIRSLGRLGAPVYAIVEDRFVPIAASRYLSRAIVWKNRGMDPETLLAGLADIGKRLDAPAILVPTDDAAAALVAEQADTLQTWFLFPRLPGGLPALLTNKKDLHHLCKTMRRRAPKRRFPNPSARWKRS